MSDIALKAENLGKKYIIGHQTENGRYTALRDVMVHNVRKVWTKTMDLVQGKPIILGDETEEIWALKDVNFEIQQGEAFGVIGRNGAGKSTLLKVLSRITEPSSGRATIKGRVASLLEVGTGFHPELTGRENIYLNGAILGMKRAEITQKFDEIVVFAGVEKFIDTPVKRYSSGMYVRLAFSVAAHLETEVLFVDEVLAVGDAGFQMQCLNKMAEVAGSGKTIMFVSHNMEAITKLCGRCLLIDEGMVSRIGTPRECIDQYLSVERSRKVDQGTVSLLDHPGRRKVHNGPIQLTGLTILEEKSQLHWTGHCGQSMLIIFAFDMKDNTSSQKAVFDITFSNMYGHRITTCRSQDGLAGPFLLTKSGQVICRIPKLPLVPGLYRVSVGCAVETGPSDGIYDAAVLEVTGTDFYSSGTIPRSAHGEVLFEHEWNM